jgi:hypothetical protein
MDTLVKLDLTQIDGDDQRIRHGCSICPTSQHSSLGRNKNPRELYLLINVLCGLRPTRNFRVVVVPLK